MKTFVGIMSTIFLIASVIGVEAAEVKPDAIILHPCLQSRGSAAPNHQRIPILRSSAFRFSSTARVRRRA